MGEFQPIIFVQCNTDARDLLVQDQPKLSFTIWIDVEDLFEYALHARRPSGIQRIEYELCRALATLPESRERVKFLRHSSPTDFFRPVDYQAIENLFGNLVAESSSDIRRKAVHAEMPGPGNDTGVSRHGIRGLFRRLAHKLPSDLRVPLLMAYQHQRSSIAMTRPVARAMSQVVRRALRKAVADSPVCHACKDASPEHVSPGISFDDARAGDILLVLGSPWFQSRYADLIRKAQTENGVRFALLVYDLIPLRRPEWCDANLVKHFRSWFDAVLPLTDILLTISKASAADILFHAEAEALTLLAAPQVIRIGTGFSSMSASPTSGLPARDRSLPPVNSYVLIVSTIEARKNHLLLFRVWRRLLDEQRSDQVPTLVIAGRIGWLVTDLMQQLRNAAYLGGKIVVIEDPSDAELQQLYAGCLFTLFPSFYEGWGLPVTESLAFGRPCVISNSTSLPEAGGTLARYFDPDDLNEAYRVIRSTIEDREGLKNWQARVTRDFRIVSWETAARSLLACLG